jgi:hypothetical protein
MIGQKKKMRGFEDIFESAGPDLVKIYSSSHGCTVMLEAKLRSQ